MSDLIKVVYVQKQRREARVEPAAEREPSSLDCMLFYSNSLLSVDR